MSYSNAFLPGRAVAATPSDTADAPFYGLYVGGSGDVAITDEGGGVTTFKAVPTGGYVNVRGTRVMATGTTATNLVRLLPL